MSKNQDIGLRGEKAFSLACSSAGLICNKSLEDMAGWDFYVQFALDKDYTGSLDHRPPALCAFIQVKTFTRKVNRIELKLSNAERMVSESRPTFFAIGVDNSRTGEISFLLGHIGEKAIAFILEKLRQVGEDQIPFINRKKIYIPIDSLETEAVQNPSDIAYIIRKYSSNDIENYIREKIRTTKIVGYNSESYRGSFSVDGSNAGDQIVALMIGEIDKISVSNFIVTETRFNIKSTKHSADSGLLKISPTSSIEGKVIFTGVRQEICAEYNVNIRVPSIPNLPSELFRIRFESELFAFSVSLSGHVTNWRINPSWNTHKSWNKIKNDVNLMQLLNIGKCEIKCFKNSSCLMHGELTIEEFTYADLGNVDDFHAAIRAVDELCRVSEVKFCLNFSMGEFFYFLKNNRTMIYMISSFRRNKLIIGSTINVVPTENYLRGKFIFPLMFRCEDLINAIPLIAEGSVKIIGKGVKMNPDKIYPGACKQFQTKSQCLEFLKCYAKKLSAEAPEGEFIVVHDSIFPKKRSHLLYL